MSFQSCSAISPARLRWQQDNTPTSVDYEDIYYSTDNGLAETRYVFLQHNHLIERWQTLQDQPDCFFTVAETGFGSGLNFLATWALWQQHAPRDARLHYIGVEKHPLTSADLRRALGNHDQLARLAHKLIALYPPLAPGFHRLNWETDRVSLTLLFGDAADSLSLLQARVDAWHLDGFAPARNPDMWSPDLFTQIARLSRSNTTFATFTAAGIVRRGLQAVGFDVHKTPGFGRKRDMLAGRFRSHPEPDTTPLTAAQNPWYHPPAPVPGAGRALVIGAGLAGAAIAHKLAQRGWQIQVLEQLAQPALATSGNLQGTTYTRFSPHLTPQNRFYQQAFWYANGHLPQWMQQADQEHDIQLNGVIQLAKAENTLASTNPEFDFSTWRHTGLQWLTADAISDLLGFHSTRAGLWLPMAGWVHPPALVRCWLDHANIHCRYHFHVTDLQQTENGEWLAINPLGEQCRGDIVIVANSLAATQLTPTTNLPLRPVRGQVTHLSATPGSLVLRHAVNYDGYVTPARNGVHSVGATFHPRLRDTELRPDDHLSNLDRLQDALPELAARLQLPPNPDARTRLGGKVGFRCQTPDYLPIVGPIPAWHTYQTAYQGLRTGAIKGAFSRPPYLSGIYASLAFGSRGLTSPALAADILVGYIHGEPFPVDEAVRQSLHPARFAIRALKKSRN